MTHSHKSLSQRVSRPCVIACLVVLTATCVLSRSLAAADPLTIQKEMVHLRSGTTQEWDDFPSDCDTHALHKTFTIKQASGPATLVLRQEDVKENWDVRLNGKSLTKLTRDESPIVRVIDVADGLLKTGDNTLDILPVGKHRVSDDIRLGEIRLHFVSRSDWLAGGSLAVRIVDAATGSPLPGRITIVQDDALIEFEADSNAQWAIRPGVVYTASGQATLTLPAGAYTVFAGRGFEYSLARRQITLSPGDALNLTLPLRREVETTGYVACDTHIHTFTHSGHGDATVAERLVTIAGEGIELPIATDHNVQVDYSAGARSLFENVPFTMVTGNEVTTPVGHFNTFPVSTGAQPPRYKFHNWTDLFQELDTTTQPPIIILNHARDIHYDYRPFDPANWNALLAEQLSGWPIGFNAMETVNSGATQTDPLRLFRDWMGLWNAGDRVTPVGSSDSHDVSRYIVGQGRTYVRCADQSPGSIDVTEAVDSLRQGHVLVSYGLLVEATGPGGESSGDLMSVEGESIPLNIRVQGPHWTTANRVLLYANGQLLRDETISPERDRESPGVIWSEQWNVACRKHDMMVTVIALGPGIDGLFWPTAKPYQPLSIRSNTQVIACSGALQLDCNGDGRWTSPREVARQLLNDSSGEDALLKVLESYDAAVAAHVAHMLWKDRNGETSKLYQQGLASDVESIRTGFRNELESRRAVEMARLRSK